ncbi:LacI family DNA-binding transcriptional regulator [Bifidobacterium platyrrhinorum]|nr:LacI family DNA-binding transcriptional regulator [Bifidobacterium platyrrhinorum]
MASKRVKAQDVANLAGVSRTTVSFVLNNRSDSIPEATRQRVLDAARKLGYVPSAAARTLRAGGNNIVLVLTRYGVASEAGDEMHNAISSALERCGLTCLLSRSAGDTSPLSRMLSEVRPCIIISFFPVSDDDRRMLERLDIPLLELGEGASSPSEFSYANLQHRIGFAQAEYLIGRGCRDLVYVVGDDSLIEGIHEYRYRGVAEAVARHAGVGLAGRVNVDADSGEGFLGLDEGMPDGVDGVCAFNDTVAAAVLAWAGRRGVDVPGDLRVIGVDNLRFGMFLDPPLTSVTIDANEGWSDAVVAAVLDRLGRSPAGDGAEGASAEAPGRADDADGDGSGDFGIRVVARRSA